MKRWRNKELVLFVLILLLPREDNFQKYVLFFVVLGVCVF